MSSLPRTSRAVLLTAALATVIGPVAADDRDLLRTGSTVPYVFIIFDTSGSMNWTTPCTAEDREPRDHDNDPMTPDQPLCTHVCETKDCWAKLNADDADSKMYQAKAALYEVLGAPETAGVSFGFASYNQDNLQILRRHFLYRMRAFADQSNGPIDLLYEHPADGNSDYDNPTGYSWPPEGAEDVFGTILNCTSGSRVGCWRGNSNTDGSADTADGNGVYHPADINVEWERLRVGRISKQIESTALTTFARIRVPVPTADGNGPQQDTQTYRVGYRPLTALTQGTTPTPLDVEISVSICYDSGGNCDDRGGTVTRTYTYDLVSDFVPWENGVANANDSTPLANRLDDGDGYFGSGFQDAVSEGTCEGYDPNDTNPGGTSGSYPDESTDDDTVGSPTYSLKNPTVLDTNTTQIARPSILMSRGDVIPLDWDNDNKDLIQQRLAPNIALGETDPDFRIARYLKRLRHQNDEDPCPPQTSSCQTYYRLANGSAPPPLLASGSTPLGNAMADFRRWYTGCTGTDCGAGSGWRHLAALNDPSWGCRATYILFITDGDETCSSDPCAQARFLFEQHKVKTYVVGFGLASAGGNRLDCMASDGGTGQPFRPQNKQQLIDDLKSVFSEIQEDVRAFASAAVPTAQAQVADKAFFTTFRPLKEASIWPGKLNAFLKPVPLTDDGRPNDLPADEVGSKPCGPDDTANCHLWDAAEEMKAQVPTQAELALDPDPTTNAALQLGLAADERRLFYAEAANGGVVPRVRHLYSQEGLTSTEKYDLWRGLGLNLTGVIGDPDREAEAQTTAQGYITHTLVLKEENYTEQGDDPETVAVEPPTYEYEVDVDYILGDIFHSDPVLAGEPSNLKYFAANLYDNGRTCDDESAPNPGYACFADYHRYRRKIVIVGSNDGALHAFDAGKFHGEWLGAVTDNNLRIRGEFDNGTGREIFSFMPREALRKQPFYATADEQTWSVDGRIVIDDAFIDRVHDGTPDPDQRRWRTLLLGGLREGGRGYYALDITQPDRYPQLFIPEEMNTYVPSCTDGGTGCGAAYPSVLWELADGWDEDDNGRPDLGETWSIVNTGRILVREDDALVDKFVAVFGGGMDPEKLNSSGDWLYMVDVETGKVIYKEALDGSAPSEPAAVDTNLDGYIDTIYIGTTAGFMYKVNLLSPPLLEDHTVTDHLTGTDHVVRRIDTADTNPFKVFNTGGLPIYYPPAVFFVPELTRYALAFGTGDRESLWEESGLVGRFITILDDGWVGTDATLPRTIANLEAVAVELPGNPAINNEGDDYLNDTPASGSSRGWYFTLDPDERLITKPVVISGLMVFSMYSPETTISQPDDDDPTLFVCSRTGVSRIFVVLATNGDAFVEITDAGGNANLSRFWQVSDFVTNPYTESSGTANTAGDATGQGPLAPELERLREKLKSLFPKSCRFANHTIDVKTILSNTQTQTLAPIPVCIDDKSWREEH